MVKEKGVIYVIIISDFMQNSLKKVIRILVGKMEIVFLRKVIRKFLPPQSWRQVSANATHTHTHTHSHINVCVCVCCVYVCVVFVYVLCLCVNIFIGKYNQCRI